MSEDQLTHWNHRIVRRYAPNGLDYLEITEVYYVGNKPKTSQFRRRKRVHRGPTANRRR